MYQDQRSEAIRQLLKGADNIYSCDVISKGLDDYGWIVHPVTVDGIVVGAIIQKENDIHTSIAPEFHGKWNPRPYILNILYPAFFKYGHVNSEAEKYDDRGIRWLKKLGFEQTGEDELKLYFSLTKLKFLRRYSVKND